MKLNLKATLGILGFSMLSVGVAVDSGVFNIGNLGLRLSRAADGFNTTLDHDNAPTLSGGSGTIIDDKDVTWEYSGCSSYASGHVTVNKDGYFGISSLTGFGYTKITQLTVNFTSTGGGELWLMTSLNGTSWIEMDKLTSGTATSIANNWRYIRFLDYGPAGNQINVASVSIDYECFDGISASEDSDGAKCDNVKSVTSNITYQRETQEVSPLGNSTEAVRFTKNSSGTTSIVISFGRTYKVGQIAYKLIEFDIYLTIEYSKTLQMTNETSNVGASVDSSKHSAYKITKITGTDYWYHVEVPVSALVSLISGYTKGGDPKDDDIPAKNLANKDVNGIKINAGNCIIDNLRITSNQRELGSYNNGSSFAANSVYWFKVCWVGRLVGCTMSFSNSNAEQVSLDDPNLLNGSPFYIRGLSAGSVTATAYVTVADHTGEHTLSISRELTVN